ncbi:MAG TPA: hypothetical protein VNZ52_09215 [Candidatus Thermoplasmatota archaeon]|nr:hypothetical protein [Candidatus Thermoplasmatota archaeon]
MTVMELDGGTTTGFEWAHREGVETFLVLNEGNYTLDFEGKRMTVAAPLPPGVHSAVVSRQAGKAEQLVIFPFTANLWAGPIEGGRTQEFRLLVAPQWPMFIQTDRDSRTGEHFPPPNMTSCKAVAQAGDESFEWGPSGQTRIAPNQSVQFAWTTPEHAPQGCLPATIRITYHGLWARPTGP